MLKTVTIFSDGAAKGNPGPGGYGVVIFDGKTVTELGGHKARTTNNEMELKAVVEALTFLGGKTKTVAIYTDSKYVVSGATAWIFGWQNNGWQTKAKTDVVNKELWQSLASLLKQVKVDWHKVPGHVGIIGNERADVIASTFASAGKYELYSGPRSGYDYAIENTQYDESKAQERSDARKRSALKAYSYVSLVDGLVKIHKTWAECEARVKGKRGVRFKKSLDVENEREIVREFGG